MGATMGDTVPFGELVSLLSKAAPARLAALREQFPAHVTELKPGSVLGDDQPENLACAVAIEALNSAAAAADGLRTRIRQRLKWSLRFDFLAKFAAACGSGGALGLLAGSAAVDKGIIAAAIAFAGSLAGLVFSYLQRDETSGSVADSYNKLITALVQCGDLQRSLPVLCRSGSSPELKEALARANETARTLNELILRYA